MAITPDDARGEIEVAFMAIRNYVDATGYGKMISDDHCRELAVAVITAVEKYRNGEQI